MDAKYRVTLNGREYEFVSRNGADRFVERYGGELVRIG